MTLIVGGFARRMVGGIMFWAVDPDAQREFSLVYAIYQIQGLRKTSKEAANLHEYTLIFFKFVQIGVY